MSKTFADFVIPLAINLVKNHISVKEVRYDNVRLIKAGKFDELKADLEERLDITIVRIETGTVDFIRDSAVLQISYLSKEPEVNTADAIEKEIEGAIWEHIEKLLEQEAQHVFQLYLSDCLREIYFTNVSHFSLTL